jgi:TubC N-terminal docking domain
MNAHALLNELRSQDVHLEAEGSHLIVNAPAGTFTDELRLVLTEHKPSLLKVLEWERCKYEEADRRGFVARWSREPGWISLHDPLTGEWHDWPATDCFPSIVAEANRRHKNGGAA